jgi:hypothetical protein
MANAMPTPASTSAQSRDQVRALVGEYLDQKKRETHETSLVEAPRRLRTALMVVGIITCAIVWILPSLVKPPVEAPTPERVEASARMTLFLAAERVRAYQRASGKLPATLAQAGADTTGISYFRATDSLFEMWTTANGARIMYRSTMNNAEFLGTTLQTISFSR